MPKIFFPLILFAALFLTQNSFEAASFSITPNATCIKVYDGGRQPNGQQMIRFYNSCTANYYINACVKDDSGTVKLYKSSSRIYPNNTFTIYTVTGYFARAVSWTAAPTDPPIPVPCKNEKGFSGVYNPRS